jgi:hypothetical protein
MIFHLVVNPCTLLFKHRHSALLMSTQIGTQIRMYVSSVAFVSDWITFTTLQHTYFQEDWELKLAVIGQNGHANS